MRRRSWSSAGVRFFRLDHEAVVEELRGYAQKALEKGARAVILIGSLARGDYTAFSDADIIIISDDVPERPMDRVIAFMDPTLSVDVEPRVYTTEEFLRMAGEARRIVREVVEHGVLLAGDGELIEEARRKLFFRASQ